MTVRVYRPEDCEKTIELFFNTIHSINSKDYTETQLCAWASEDMDLNEWNSRLLNNYTVVAEMNDGIIGFGSVDSTGYFDLLYTHKDYQRIGVATFIADDIEGYICRKGIQTMMTAASITAKPFFEKRGYLVLYKQTVECRGQLFVNFKMQKTLR